MKYLPSINTIIYFAITTLIIVIPAFYNGYPFVHQDSGQYLAVSQTLDTNGYAPIGYSYFIRIVSWQTLVWTVILFQALIMNLYIYFSWKVYIGDPKKNIKIFHFTTLVLLSIFSGLGWYTSLLMPDAFTVFMIFAIFFFVRKESGIWVRVLNGFFIFWAGVSHLSNTYIALLLFIILIILYFGIKKYNNQISLKPILLIILLVISSNLFIRTYNYTHDYGFVTTRYKSGALMAKFVEYGILEDYLKKNCSEKDFMLCDYIDKLPNTTGDFIWSSNSPYNKGGSWEKVSKEYETITNEIISKPKYLIQYFSKSIFSSIKQFTRINIYFPARRADSSPFIVIKDRFRNDFQSFKSSLQYWEKIDMKPINRIYYLLYILSGLFLLIKLFRGNFNASKILFPIILTAGLLSNAITSGTLATVVDRFQARVGWILILLAIIIFIEENYTLIKGMKGKFFSFIKN